MSAKCLSRTSSDQRKPSKEVQSSTKQNPKPPRIDSGVDFENWCNFSVDDTERSEDQDLRDSSSNSTPNSARSPNPSVPDDPSTSPPNLLHLSFNQDLQCFCAGTDQGFRIYNCDPFGQIFRRGFDHGGFGVVEMLFRTSAFALVGRGRDPRYSPDKVVIWADHHRSSVAEMSFRSEVLAVRLTRDRIVVVLEEKIIVYSFSDLRIVHKFVTIANPKGLCEVSQGEESFVLVCPGFEVGQIRVERYAAKETKFILAHSSGIACLALAQDGNVLATASAKGTLVRIYNTADGSLLQEVRRGADKAEIYCLAFSPTVQWLAVSSNKGTVHVFSLKVNPGSAGNDKPDTAAADANHAVLPTTSSLSFIKGVLPKYFSSEWSVTQFRLHEGCQNIVAFGHQENTVVILGMDGSFYRCQFDPVSRGEMTQLEFHNFLNPKETSI